MPSKLTLSIQEYAKAHGIRPNFEVPKSSKDNEKIKHQDNNLQTLFYPEDLERKGRALKKDTKRILDEKGTNTLHLSFDAWSGLNLRIHQEMLPYFYCRLNYQRDQHQKVQSIL